MGNQNMKNKNILIINGSVRGTLGNSAAIATKAAQIINSSNLCEASVLTLTDPMPNVSEVQEQLLRHDGFLVISGVYWNNWGSPLQKFIEVFTACENTPVFWGKPFACAISMDSVGGAEVAARLHGVFSGLGCWSPPCSTLVLSRVGLEAIEASKGQSDDLNEDVWRLDDIEIVIGNLLKAITIKSDWKSWPHVEYKIIDSKWPETGPLDMGSPKFIE